MNINTIVRVKDLPILADVGINPDEVGRRQPLVISVAITLLEGQIDRLEDTIDYRSIVDLAQNLAQMHVPLIETFAERLARICLALPSAQTVVVAVDKPFAISPGLAGVEVRLSRD